MYTHIIMKLAPEVVIDTHYHGFGIDVFKLICINIDSRTSNTRFQISIPMVIEAVFCFDIDVYQYSKFSE